jgi:drug/metabolite transporter (DMT)-like permease
MMAFDAFVARTSLLVAVMWVSFAASASFGIYWLLTGRGRVPGQAGEWLALVGLGILGSAAFFCLFHGVRRLGPMRASVIVSLEPFFSAVLAFLFLEEALRPGTVGGGLLILVGALAAARVRSLPDGGVGLP